MDSNTTLIGVHSTMSCTCIKLASSPGSPDLFQQEPGDEASTVCVFVFVVLGACVVCVHINVHLCLFQ